MKYPYSHMSPALKFWLLVACAALAMLAIGSYCQAQDTTTHEVWNKDGSFDKHVKTFVPKLHKRNLFTLAFYNDSTVQAVPLSTQGCEVRTLFVGSQSSVKPYVIVIGGDGFTASQKEFFFSEMARITNVLINHQGYVRHKEKFIVKALFRPSPVSGVSNDMCYGGTNGTIGTPYEMSLNYGGNMCRLLYATQNGIAQFISDLNAMTPGYTKGMLISNTPYYGGGGGAVACATLDDDAADILIHEFGHSGYGLKDEYSGPYCSTWSGIYPNVAKSQADALQRWGSAYLGALMSSQCAWRCSSDCEMRSLYKTFCDPCLKQIDLIMSGYGGTVTQPTCTHVGEFTPNVGSVKWKVTKGTEYKNKQVTYTVTRTNTATGATTTQKVDMPFYIGVRSGGWNSTAFTSGSKWNVKVSDPNGCVKEYNVIIP